MITPLQEAAGQTAKTGTLGLQLITNTLLITIVTRCKSIFQRMHNLQRCHIQGLINSLYLIAFVSLY